MKIITARPHRLLAPCVARIGELAAKGERCMLLVPSQYTLQAEIEVMERLDICGSFLIDVLSPNRLRSRIFERAGAPARTIIDERGKSMVISAILEEEKDALTVYHAAAANAPDGLTQKLSDMIADMKRSDVTPQALETAMEEMTEGDLTRSKLTDLHRIYADYEERIAGWLADEEDVAAEMRERMARSGVLDGVHVFVYGFDMITPTFAQDMLCMNALAKSVNLLVETDKNGAADGRLFAPVNASLDRLAGMAAERGISIEREKIDTEIEAPKSIQVLEKQLFALNAQPQGEVPEEIVLFAAGNKRAEMHRAASQIRRLAAQGLDPADVAVVYPKGSGCGALIESVFAMYGLETYVAEKRTGGAHPLCRFLLSALAVISGGWRTSDVIECAQSGFLPIDRAAVDAISAYAEGVDLRAEAWKRPFTYLKDEAQGDLESLNEAREKITAPLLALGKRLGEAKTADDTVRAMIALLEDVQAYETLQNMRDELMQAGQDTLAQDCAQVYNRLMETLDQLHTLLGARNVPSSAVLRLLESGLSALELAALPTANGAIICGEIGNVRTAEVKVLFAIGMNDTGAGADNGLLTQQEREEAERATKAYLGMNASQRAALAQLDALKALSGVKERLYVSYALADETGRALREDETVAAIKRLFPRIAVQGGLAQEDQEAMLVAPKAATQALSVMLSDAADGKQAIEPRAAQAYAALVKDEAGSEALRSVTRRLSQAQRERLNSTQARTLYGRPVMSVSRLETFAQCPYKHFVRYGLNPTQEVTPGVDRAELGTLYHAAAEQFTRKVSALPGFPEVDTATCDAIMDEAMKPLIAAWRESPLGKSQRGGAIAAKIEKTARRTGRNILSQYAGGGFSPMHSEMIFGKGSLAPIALELRDGTVIYLQGRIDRIDVMDGERIRVIDYKSGAKKFDPTMAYWGLQLQLMIYLAAALARLPGTSAAGFFYCRIADPTVKTESRVKEEIEKQLAKQLALAGISLSDVTVLRAQGASHAAMISRDGTPNGRYAGSMVDSQGMEALVAFAREKAASIAQEVYQGVVEDAPAEFGQYDACTMCDYAAVCGFDPARGRKRRLAAKKLDDLIAKGAPSEKKD